MTAMLDTYRPRGVRDVAADKFIAAYAAHLKAGDKLELPAWVDLVKTAPRKELAPLDPDWYYIRAASIARKIYLRQGLGVGLMRRQYGGRKSRGTCPERFEKSAGGLIRHIMQSLEQLELVEKDTEGRKGGRRITGKGQQDLDLIASRLTQEMPEEEEEEEAAAPADE